jgi:hypothetical protein
MGDMDKGSKEREVRSGKKEERSKNEKKRK